jgi:hypothetical protein
MRQISASVDESTASRLMAASESMMIPLSAVIRLVILHGIGYLDKFCEDSDLNE